MIAKEKKHSSLLWKLVNYRHEKFYNIDTKDFLHSQDFIFFLTSELAE